jgi:hypothetical protein
LQLDSIDLHEAGLLPGRVTGVVYNPDAGGKPFANAFGFLCTGEDDFDTVGGCYYLLECMTDANGRFRIDACPPGQYVLRFSDSAHRYAHYDPSVWIRVTPEEAIDLRLFAPERDHQLAINFVVGDGSPPEVHAGTGLDAGVIAKHVDPKTKELPFIRDDDERLRAQASEILCALEPLDETTTHWPIYIQRFAFSPANLLKNNARDIVIPNVTPGRWRVTLTARYSAVYSSSETLLTREIVVTERMAPLEIDLPAAALAGTFEDSTGGVWFSSTIEAIPQDPKLPVRTCRAQAAYRFIGLAPGKYSLRFRSQGCEPKRVDDVVVRRGETTLLEKVVLKRTAPSTEYAP